MPPYNRQAQNNPVVRYNTFRRHKRQNQATRQPSASPLQPAKFRAKIANCAKVYGVETRLCAIAFSLASHHRFWGLLQATPRR
jgi:hypothetical protein